MKILLILLRKEFKQVMRNRALLPMIFVMPIIQLIILPLAADYEVKNINISIVDHDRSPISQKLVEKIVSSGYFQLNDCGGSYHDAFAEIENNHSDLVLEIPQNFEKGLVRENYQSVFIAVNAINGVKASLGGAYLNQIIRSFNQEIVFEWIQVPRFPASAGIEVTSTNWFNPRLNYNFFMVPGILAILVTMVGAYMCSLNIVKEKEIGTIEQINVSPIKKHIFILGKLIPFWLIGMFIFSIGLLVVSRWVYGIVSVGSLLLIYSYLALYLVALLGLGLLLSTNADTQQQAMSLTFFFMMIFILMSGLYTPIESMPKWAWWITQFNPVTYFIEVLRMIILKGSGFADIKKHFLVIGGFAIFFNTWAVLNYSKRS